MIHKVLVTPIIGLPQVTGWAQVTQSSEGRFVCAFGVSGSQAGNVGRDLVDLLKSNPPDNATSVYALVKKTVRFVTDKDCKLQFAAGFFDPQQTIFTAYNGALLLKRNGKVGTILSSENNVRVIEGQKLDEDIFVLLTGNALEFKEDIVQKLGQGLDADTTVASVVPGVQNLPDSSLVAMAFVSDWTGESEFSGVLRLDDEPTAVEDAGLDFNVEEVSDKTIEEDFVSISKKADSTTATDSEVGYLPTLEIKTDQKKMKVGAGDVSGKFKGAIVIFGKILRKFFSWIILFFSQLIKFFKSIYSKDVYVNGEQNTFKKKLKIVVAILLILIIAGGAIFFFKWRQSKQVQAAQESVSEQMAQYQVAKDTAEVDPIATRESLAGILDELGSKQKAFKEKSAGYKYIGGLIKEVGEYSQSISGQEVFNDLEVFFDFGLVESDFIAHKADLQGENAYFFDRDKKNVIELNLATKSFKQFDLSSLEIISDLAYDDENLYAAGLGVSRRSLEESSDIEKVIEEGKANREAKSLAVFSSHIYTLSIDQRNVFKYPYDADAEKFTEPIRWVKSAKDLDFSQVTEMVIDGDIWLSTKDGKIFKLSAGEGSPLEIRGLTKPFSSQLFMFTHFEGEKLYVLEPQSSRLVILNKNGEFIREIESISLASANGLIVNAQETKAFIISGSLVFEVRL